MESSQLKNIVEAALLAAGTPLTVGQLQALFGDSDGPEKSEIREVLKELQEDYEGRGIEIREVGSGFRVQVRDGMSPWLSKLWEERPPRYSRALMETLAIIAYRQPVTRGDIEEIRGVAVTSNIIRTLLEREWIKVVGHRDVPGKPAMFGTTRLFLDYFNLKKLDDLPPLAELAELEPMGVQLKLDGTDIDNAGEAPQPGDAAAAADLTADANPDHVAVDPQADADVDGADEDEGQGEQTAPEGSAAALLPDDFDDEDEDLSDDELAAAAAKIDAITAELSGKKAPREEDSSAVDVAPGAVKPLVGLSPPGEEPPEPATVSSLDEARAAAADKEEPAAAGNDQPADVVPIKS